MKRECFNIPYLMFHQDWIILMHFQAANFVLGSYDAKLFWIQNLNLPPWRHSLLLILPLNQQGKSLFPISRQL